MRELDVPGCWVKHSRRPASPEVSSSLPVASQLLALLRSSQPPTSDRKPSRARAYEHPTSADDVALSLGPGERLSFLYLQRDDSRALRESSRSRRAFADGPPARMATGTCERGQRFGGIGACAPLAARELSLACLPAKARPKDVVTARGEAHTYLIARVESLSK